MDEYRRSIVCSNSYGTPNVGDEALLTSLLCELSRRASDYVPAVLSRFAESTAQAHPHVQVVSSHAVRGSVRTLRAIRNASLLIVGPGGILQDKSSVGNLIFHLSRIAMARICGTPSVGCGLGVGPIDSWLGRSLARMGLKCMEHIAVRDEASAVVARSLGMPDSKITVASDLAFLLPSGAGVDKASCDTLSHAKANGSLMLGLSLRPEPGRHKAGASTSPVFEEMVEQLASEIRELAGSRPVHVLFVSMHPEQDDALGYRLKDMLGVEMAFSMLSGVATPAMVFEAMSYLDVMVGMRLHALLFASRCLVPVVPLTYDPKVTAFASYIGAEARCIPYESVTQERLSVAIQDAIANKKYIQDQLKPVVQAATQSAHANIDIVIKALKPNGV